MPEDTALAVLDSFNRMYRHVLAYMVKEVGPIAENVLAKYLNTRARVAARGARRASPCARTARSTRRRWSATSAAWPRSGAGAALVDALNELLYAELLAVKRTLGADHESAIVRDLRPPR